MTFKNNSNFSDSKLSNKIEFTITENIAKIGIKEFVFQSKDFLITWTDGRDSCIDFKSLSISQNSKLIEKTIKKEVKGIVDDETFDNAVKDIEDQLVKRREEIFNLGETKEINSDQEFKSKFLEDVSNLREQFEKSSDPYKEWQNQVNEKYMNLENIVNRIYPNTCSIIQFISLPSVKSKI